MQDLEAKLEKERELNQQLGAAAEGDGEHGASATTESIFKARFEEERSKNDEQGRELVEKRAELQQLNEKLAKAETFIEELQTHKKETAESLKQMDFDVAKKSKLIDQMK